MRMDCPDACSIKDLMNLPPDLTEDWPPPAHVRPVLRVRDGEAVAVDDMLVDEVPVALVYNGISHAVMMATPADLEEFALGFSLSEGIIEGPAQCYGIEVERSAAGLAVHLDIASGAFMTLKERRRSLAGRTGCGLCGVESLDQASRSLRRLAPATGFHAAGVRRALAGVKAGQQLTHLTGAAHAAAWCGMAGDIRIAREDVGRHNALDKVIGALAREGSRPADGFLLITSRVSYEMAQKAAMAGISALVGMSAPTLAAVDLAEGVGMTLLAFARGRDFVCYTHADRLKLSE